MRKCILFLSSRNLWLAVLGISILILTGDRGTRAAALPYQGVDPLFVLTQQVKNNVLFVIDTSGSMKWPVGVDYSTVGDDDPLSRAYVAKKAVRKVVKQHQFDINMGVASYDVLPTQKALNLTQNFDGGNGGDSIGSNDGPFIYVTNDPNASVFYGSTGTCKDSSANTSSGTGGSAGPANQGFFCGMNDNYARYSGTDSTSTFRSFGNIGKMATPIVDPSCTTNCNRYYIQSHLFRSNVTYTWNRANALSTVLTSAPTAATCGTPPAGLTGDWNDDSTTDPVVPCIVFHDAGTNKDITFWYTSTVFEIAVNGWKTGVTYNPGDIVDAGGNNSYICIATHVSDATTQPTSGANYATYWAFNTGGINCAGAAVLSVVPVCTQDNSQVVLDAMRPALPIKDVTHLGNDSSIVANTVKDYMNATTPTNVDVGTGGWGLRFDQGTPLKSTLDDIMNANPAAFPAQANANQKNFVILLTDGDDTCADNNLDTAANLASQSAKALYTNANFQRRATTFVITLGSNATRAGKIAVAGSGGPINTATCGGLAGCTDAYGATSVDSLVTALNNAISIATTSGNFTASTDITGTVFELDDPGLLPSITAATPGMRRYLQPDNAKYSTSFDMPNFEGHLLGFRNQSSGTFGSYNSTATSAAFDGGGVLKTLITNGSLKLSGGVTHVNASGFTFAELHGGATVDNLPVITATTTAPAIKRRIFTSQGNGTFARSSLGQWDSSAAAGRNVVALWPPNQSGLTAPSVSGFSNGLDPAVGTVGDFDAAFGISTKPAATLLADLGACDNSTSSPAGSRPSNCTGTATQQDNQSRKEARQILLAWLAGAQLVEGADGKPLRDSSTSQSLLYGPRPFILLDSVLSTPAVVPPPLRGTGRTPTVHTSEFTLYTVGTHASSDLDLGYGQTAPDTSTADPSTLRPRMTTVFMGASDGLHAFNALTGVELWSYVPFDQLQKVYLLARDGQSASDHKYMISSSPRSMDVFMPSSFTVGGNNYAGHWRTVLVFGRGPGGKYYTMLDITAPGPYTRDPLRTNPPWVLWNRGNPDTIDGTTAGTAVNVAADTTAYSKLGETWATPEIGNIGTSFTPEWRMFVGSGYSSVTTEGSTFYAMDVVTGNVLASVDLAQGTRNSTNTNAYNAMPGNPTGYNPSLLDFPDVASTSTDVMTRVYQPDIQGRIWKFLTATNTMDKFVDSTNNGGLAENSQPFGTAVNLVNQALGGTKHVVVAESGWDNRVSDNGTIPFQLYAWDDVAQDALTPKGTLLNASQAGNYPIAMPAGYRGNAQPQVAFTAQKAARVFFLGLKFNSASNTSCASSFQNILYLLGAITGGPAYSLPSGLPYIIPPTPGPTGTPAPPILNVSTQGGVLSGTNLNCAGKKDAGSANPVNITTTMKSERLGSSVCTQ